MTERIKLEFVNFVDLQTRLVLLPRVEEEGIGAVIAGYKAANEVRQTVFSEEAGMGRSDQISEIKKETTLTNNNNDEPESHDGKDDTVGAQSAPTEDSDDVVMEEKKDDAPESVALAPVSSNTGGVLKSDVEQAGSVAESSAEEEQSNVIGKVLTGIENTSSDEDWKVKEFTSILATIREAPTPIVLLFDAEASQDEGDGDCDARDTKDVLSDDKSVDSGDSLEESEEERKLSQQTQSPMRNTLGGRLSTWGSRAAILAAEAASGAASLSAAVKSAAAERAKSVRSSDSITSASKQTEGKPSDVGRYALFVQSTSGRFLPLPEKCIGTATKGESAPEITTTSLILLRQADSQACPIQGYHFQWYRSCDCQSDVSVSDISSRSSYTHDGNHSGVATEWTLLSGATYAAYQPSATDVGHRLRCEVTIPSKANSHSDDHDSLHEETVLCETRDVVTADASLFNSARQALVRGAQFGSLQGRGNAEGRTFRLNIEISRLPSQERKAMDVTSAVTIYQVSGDTAEPIHEEPLLSVSAFADPSQPKAFDLLLPSTPADMVSALSTEGRFQLLTPNRITRETLLLALGIANYKGKPAELDVKTVLYSGSFPEDRTLSGSIVEATPRTSNKSDEMQFFTPPEDPGCVMQDNMIPDATANARVEALELELDALRMKLVRKDKVVSDLQRQLTQSEKQRQKAETSLSSCRSDLENSRSECRESRSSLRKVEKRMETHQDTLQRLKRDHAEHRSSLESRIKSQADKISSLEKSVRSLQNEKAVLSAAVEARDSKLSKMAEMQLVVDSLSEKVSRGDALRMELNDMSHRYAEITREMEKVSSFERECREELQQTRKRMEELNDQLTKEQQKTAGCQTQLESLQVKNQHLKAERNNYKQKADSLSKEVSRICRRGRTIREVEKLLADGEALREEVSLLKSQKRQALQDLHDYRTSYEQTMIAQERAGVDGEAMRALEQKAELERVIADMTEYLQAKEMQLETLKQVNETLSQELHQLAQANMCKNDI